MVDYHINLSKSVTSTPEQRRKFYNGMMLYLAICSAGMVYVAYLASFNVKEAYNSSRQRKQMIQSISSVSGFGKRFYKDPSVAYGELQLYASDLTLLKTAFLERSCFLPVFNQLFPHFTADVVVESLEVYPENKSFVFELAGAGQSVKTQQAAWKKNVELNNLVRSIKQIKGEQRMIGGQSVNLVKFECILK